MADRIADHDGKHGLRWAAATAMAAVGATLIFDRIKPRRRLGQGEIEAPDSRTGRGTPGSKPSRRSREAGYELRDTNVRALVIVMVVSLVMIASTVTGVFTMYAHFDRASQVGNAALTAQQRAPIDPPLPHLQANPYRDIDAVLMEQTRRLTTYGWDDPDHKQAHIPIERAMRQVIGKPLDGAAQADAGGAPPDAPILPPNPASNALDQQNKPADRIQGEGRPGAVAPSFDPASQPGAKP